MEKENNTRCPICDWEPPDFKGVYYRFDKENRLRQDLHDFQLKEKKLLVPKNYYPKFTNVVDVVPVPPEATGKALANVTT